MKPLRIAAVLALTAVSAVAHSVWIEPLELGLAIRFGELDGRMEKSPGHLDKLSVPSAFTIEEGVPALYETLKRTNHFSLHKSSLPKVVCAETTYAVMTVPGNPGRKPLFYARWHPPGAGAGTPSLNLDLVPTGKRGEVRVYFRGQPLGGVKAIFRTPDEREREITSDNDGYLRFEVEQSGFYHLSIGRYRETETGFFGGDAYGLASHNAALTWVQP